MFDPDGDCSCGGHAVKKINNKTKETFWGCSEFPACKNTWNGINTYSTNWLVSEEDELMAYYSAFYNGDG